MEATPAQIDTACQGALHPMAVRGIELFNAGHYWRAHEALEEAWLEERGPVRHLYRGILQVGVVYLHVQRANYRGAVKVDRRCRRWLDPFPERCRGIDLTKLRADLDRVMTEVLRLGPQGLTNFDMRLLQPISLDSPRTDPPTGRERPATPGDQS